MQKKFSLYAKNPLEKNPTLINNYNKEADGRQMKGRVYRGLTFGAQESKALHGLNPGTCLAIPPRDGASRLEWKDWEGGRVVGPRGVGSLLITTVLKCSQALLGLALSWWFLMLSFLPCEQRVLSLDTPSLLNEERLTMVGN